MDIVINDKILNVRAYIKIIQLCQIKLFLLLNILHKSLVWTVFLFHFYSLIL